MDDDSFREFIGVRLDPLRRTAYLMSGDWHAADDVVSTAVTKIYQDWRRISQMENLDAYVRRTLVNTWLMERRRPWRRERSVPDLPPVAGQRADDQTVNDRLSLLKHLVALPPRQRAVVVLRFYCDLSVEQTAQVLDCSTGTVKSQAARALVTLRAAMIDVPDLVEG
jgi:RNA polymerase sigma-70 factor (sigma-E family)